MTQFNFSMSRAMTRPQGSDYFHSVLSTCSTFRPSQEDFCFLREKIRLFRTRILNWLNTHLEASRQANNKTMRPLRH